MDSARMMKVILDYFGVSNAELAKMLDMDQSYITHIINDKRVPSLDRLEKIADKMGIPLWLLIMAGYPKEMERFLGDGRDSRKEAEMPKEISRFVVSMRANLLRSKK